MTATTAVIPFCPAGVLFYPWIIGIIVLGVLAAVAK
jgi:hypothetical protein